MCLLRLPTCPSAAAIFQPSPTLGSTLHVRCPAVSAPARDLAVRQIIGSALVSNEVVDIFHAAGLDKPNIGILDEDFLNDVRSLPERNLAVALLERLLEGEIKTRFATNVVQHNKFSDMLANVIKRYQNRSIETAQAMEELIAMAKKFKQEAARGANRSSIATAAPRAPPRSRYRHTSRYLRYRCYGFDPTKMAGALLPSSKPTTSSRLAPASKYALPVKVWSCKGWSPPLNVRRTPYPLPLASGVMTAATLQPQLIFPVIVPSAVMVNVIPVSETPAAARAPE